MNKEINIEELKKIEDFYEDLIDGMLKKLSEQYKNIISKECLNPEIRCAFLGDENCFYDTKSSKSFFVQTDKINLGNIDSINIYNFYKMLIDVFEYWKDSAYKSMAIYFKGILIIDDDLYINIGATLYNHQDFPQTNPFTVNVMF